jgi:thioredoxin reductase
MRITKARTVLGPSGAWWLRDRVDGVIEVLTSHRVREAASEGNGVRLAVDGQKRTAIDADHVIAGTGFRIDLARLAFLPDGLRARVTTLGGYPVLSRAAESTVPGLYFVGAPAAASLGPSARFVGGTHSTVASLVRAVTRRAAANARPVTSGAGQQTPRPSEDTPFQRIA